MIRIRYARMLRLIFLKTSLFILVNLFFNQNLLGINPSKESATDYFFTHFNTQNGLPSIQVYDLYQDEYGVIWFATDRGITCYDGYKFKSFDLDDGLTSLTVFKFFPQSNGSIWCTTINNKVFYFYPDQRIFYPYKFNKKLSEKSKDGDARFLSIDSNKTLKLSFKDRYGYVSIDSNGVCANELKAFSLIDSCYLVFEHNYFGESLSYKTYGNKIVNHGFVYKIPVSNNSYYDLIEKDNLKILLQDYEIIIFRDNKFIQKIKTKNKPITLGFLPGNRFWVGFHFGGLSIFNLEGEKIRSFLEKKTVTNLLIDHENNYWFSTLFSGVFYAKNISAQNYYLDFTPNISSLSKNGKGNLIVSMKNGKLYERENNSFTLKLSSKLKMRVLYEYYPNNKEAYYFIDRETYIQKKKFNHYIPKFPDEKDIPLLFPSMDYIFSLKGKRINIERRRINDLSSSKEITLIATRYGVYSYKKNTVKNEKKTFRALDVSIKDIDLFNTNYFLIASLGKGLGIWNEKDESIKILSTKNGLNSNFINEVYVQNDSVFWVCTNLGLNRVLKSDTNYNVLSFSTLDGLIDNNILDIEIINDTVWTATELGLGSFVFDDNKSKTKPNPLYLKINNILVNGKSSLDLENLKYYQNRIELNFQAISFKENSILMYRYKFNELDTNWKYTSNQKIIYEALAPGEYTFTIEAGTNNVYTEQKVITFYINKPYYKTIWFILLIIGTIIFIIFLFFKYKILKYNREIINELLRLILKRIQKGSKEFVVREKGKDLKINSLDVQYVKSLGNYIEIYTAERRVVIREKISNFKKLVPDPLEYIQVHRSHIVRIDKITKKGVDTIEVGSTEIKIGETYLKRLSEFNL